MAGIGNAVWEASPGIGDAVWIASPGIGDAVWITSPGIGDAVWIASPGIGKAVWIAGCFPKSELVSISSDTSVPIGTLKVGDKICSWDVERIKMQYTVVTEIHEYTVMDMICFNNTMRVSFTHPLMVMETEENGILTPKWKVSFNVNVGDCVVGADGKLTTVKSKSKYRYNSGVGVLNLSTDSGFPFFVENCVVRAHNADDKIEWVDAPVTQRLAA